MLMGANKQLYSMLGGRNSRYLKRGLTGGANKATKGKCVLDHLSQNSLD